MADIKKVAVIGAGTMGAAIAAHAANAGAEVLLLDIVPKDADDRSTIAKSALEKMKKTNPAPLMHKSFAKRITPGNIEDDLKKIKTFDWIIEAVIEKEDVKKDLYKKINKHRKKEAVVSSNTSTIPLTKLVDGMPQNFTQHFMITHFFNPPRYMRLLEIISSDETSDKAVKKVTDFADVHMGKSIVHCNDTPGFIANRIGTYWLHAAVTKAIKHDVGVEEADAVLGRPAGVPKTGVFGLLDLVGLDIMPHVYGSLKGALDKDDPFHNLGDAPKLLQKLIDDGYTGRKGKGGFYRLTKKGDKKQKEVIDFQTEKFKTARRPKPAAAKAAKKGGLRALMTHKSKEGQYAFDVLAHTFSYTASLLPEIGDNVDMVDRAMTLGYNWNKGPFELMDKLGTAWFAAALKKRGMDVPPLLEKADGRPFYRTHNGTPQCMNAEGEYVNIPRPEGALLLRDVKRGNKPIFKNISASVWDIGDGVACLEFHSKMNSLNPFIIRMVNKCVRKLPKKGYKALVIHNEGNNFSVGANIMMLLVTGKLRLYPLIRLILRHGQFAFNRMKHAPFPVVGAPSGMALGGGCEILLHCNAATPHSETYIGLVEAGVGLVPGWGGCKEVLGRASVSENIKKGPMPPVQKAFELIAMAHVAKSAYEAKDALFFNADDEVVMNKDRLLATAKAKALTMAEDFTPPAPFTYALPGPTGRAAMNLGVRDFANKGVASPHDVTIADQLGMVLSGGQTDMLDYLHERDILKLERNGLTTLSKTKKTRDRIAYMIKNNKPLRN